jgi:drug/metabolite transporter (DMT)-like permease
MNNQNFKAYLAYIAVCVIWGTTYLAIKIGVTDLPPFLFAGLRWITAGIILIGYLYLRGYNFPVKDDLIHLFIVGISLLGFGNGFVVIAEQWLPSGLTSLLITTIPIWVVIIEMLLPNSPKINFLVVLGIIIGTSGVVLIFWNDLDKIFNSDYFLGILSMFGAVVVWVIGSLWSKYKKVTVKPLMGATFQMLFAGVVQVFLGSLLGEWSEFHFTQDSFYAFAYLVLIGSLFGYTSFIYAIAHLPVSFVSTYTYVNPIIALYLGWLVLNEEINIILFAATALILGGVVIVKMGHERIKAKNKTAQANR